MRASGALCEKNDKQSNRKKNKTVRVLRTKMQRHCFTTSLHWHKANNFSIKLKSLENLKIGLYFLQCSFMFSKLWKFLWWLMTSSFPMIFSLNIMIEALWPLKILLLLFLKKKFECYVFIYCYVTPAKQHRPSEWWNYENHVFLQHYRKYFSLTLH